MPVWKFSSFDAARRALWLPSGDPRILERMKRLGEMRRNPPRRQPGVTRFRSVEEADRAVRALPNIAFDKSDA